MGVDKAKERIMEIETQIEQAEEAYSNALEAKRDYNTLHASETLPSFSANFSKPILG